MSKRVWSSDPPRLVLRGHGIGRDPGAERVVGRGGVAVVVERARAVAGAPREEGVERPFEAAHLAQRGGRAVERRVDRAVEHHAPDAIGELLGVERAEVRAVRVADVVEVLLAERGAEAVEIVRGLAGREVGEDVALVGRAPGGDRPERSTSAARSSASVGENAP